MSYESIVASYEDSSKEGGTVLSPLTTGRQKIAWATEHMPILNRIIDEYRFDKPLSGHILVTSVHLEAKTACLVMALARLGATVFATGCNPLTTQDDVAIALSKTPYVTVYAKHNCSEEEYWSLLVKALSHRPFAIIDDGGDLVKLLHGEYSNYADRIIGGCEETTTGIHRLKALAAKGKLRFPMYNVNDADCKHNYDNHYGTGQSVIDGLLRTTNLIVAGKVAVVAGYGDCGSGIAERLRGLGAKIIITEVDPIKALKANMDGFAVLKMDEACKYGDIFVTATGCKDVITKNHFPKMKDGAILANAGHFNVEINLNHLAECSTKHYEARKNIESYLLKNGNTLNVLAEGRLVNLAAADGHAVEIMDMSFSIQLLGIIDIVRNWSNSIGHRTPPDLYSIPKEIDQKVAHIALETQGISIDKLSKSQEKYLKNGF